LNKKIIKNLFSLSFAELIVRIFSFLLTVYIARVFGTSTFGKVSFAQVISEYIGLFIVFGLNTIGVREIAKDKKRTQAIVTQIFSVKLLLFFIGILFIVFFVIIGDFKPEQSMLVVLYGLSAALLALLDFSWIFNGHSMMNYTGLLRILQQALYFICTAVMLLYIKDIVLFPVSMIISIILTGLVGLILCNLKINEFSLNQLFYNKRNRSLLKNNHLLKSAIYVFLSTLMVKLYYNFDTIVLKIYNYNDEVIGLYNAGYKIILLLTTFSSIIVSVVFPLLSKGSKNHKKIVNNTLKYLLIFIIPIIIGGQVVAKDLLVFIYGIDFALAANSFRILLIALFFIYINYLFGHVLLTINNEKKYTLYVFLGAIFNVVCNFIFVPKYGVVAASMTTVGAEIIVFAGYISILLKEQLINMKVNWFFKFIICLVLFLVLVYVTSQLLNVILTIIISIVVYIILIFVFKVIVLKDFIGRKGVNRD